MHTENLLNKMTCNQHTYQSAYMEFVYNSKVYKDHVFCFYEGVDDPKYYNSRVERFFADNIIKIIVGGKQEVINLHKKINVSEYKSVCKMFFIDKGYDYSIYDDTTIDTRDIYETEGYSFENYYVTPYTLQKMLSNEFNLEKYDYDNINCVRNFNDRLKEYNMIMLDFNSILFYYRRKIKCGKSICFRDKKMSDFASITLERVNKSPKYSATINQMKRESNISEENMKIYREMLLGTGDLSKCFRGKNQMEFLEEYVNLLVAKKDEFFKKKNISVNISNNKNKLTWFCNYAYTPEKLKNFIRLHYKEFRKI